ncbi:hypothetical protein RBSWK_00618 [Rhodopirellula baltica SWK14]|uniref:Uncharacterized protein n=1 Tax=Rhodopirellula baltica SWK14 TaxID=993516 RepID=L7CNT8_RHOBT|nr:hypothetical protein RBSWK_00618 [Rhodopirellula baltica SWK14]
MITTRWAEVAGMDDYLDWFVSGHIRPNGIEAGMEDFAGRRR